MSNKPNNSFNNNENINIYSNYQQKEGSFYLNQYSNFLEANKNQINLNNANIDDNKTQQNSELEKFLTGNKDEIKFEGNVKDYYIKYIKKNSYFMPSDYRARENRGYKVVYFMTINYFFGYYLIGYRFKFFHIFRKYIFIFLCLDFLTILSVYSYTKYYLEKNRIDSFVYLKNKNGEEKLKELIDHSIYLDRHGVGFYL